MKKIVSLLLALCLLAGCLPMAASAAQPEVSARSNNADPFSLQQELYFKGTHVATINLPQSWEGRVVTKTNDGFAPDYFPSITCYSRLCTEKREENGNKYCGDGKLFTIEITSGDSWKNMPHNWVGSFRMDGVRYEIVLRRVTDDRFNSVDPAIQEEAWFFHGGYEQEVIDNIVFHVETDDDTVEDDNDLTIPYELRTGTGEVILTMRFPESWSGAQVELYNTHSVNYYEDLWVFRDSGGVTLFEIMFKTAQFGHGMPAGWWWDKIGDVTIDGANYDLLFDYPESLRSSQYEASDNSELAVAYRQMRDEIPKILRNMEPNPDYDWDWHLSDSGFTDVPQNAYYCNAVEWAVNSGVTSGTHLTRFSPNVSCTRAQAVTFLWRAAGEPEPAGTAASFKDVKAGSYYEKAVQWAVEQNITGGTGNGKFSPETACSRAQIVTFLWRKEGSPETSGSAFSDVKTGEYYETAVKWAVANEITGGTGNGKFSPDARCARGQIVTFLYRYAN